MADEVILNNISDDAQSKQYISDVLMPRVFHDIPLNVLNTGSFSIINEYMSQAMEQMGFTSAFYFNESFITKAVLPDSIYSEAAIFNIGYSYATPSTCNFLLELKLEDIYKNAVYNADTKLYELIIDKDTKFNLSNGNVYSLDYDILIQYMDVPTSSLTATIPAWSVKYIKDGEMNSVAVNKGTYITYRVTEIWLCLFITASEYTRESHTIVNNMTNGIPNQDAVISCTNNIAGFDIKYIDGGGNEEWLPHDHILPIHADVNDSEPYVHYIMDNPQTIRFMFQLCGNKYFVPKLNSSYEITIYTCHGAAANFTGFDQSEQPSIISESRRYPNNGNIMRAGFVISGSTGGTDIGTVETVRRETIEAYNTANVISSDHDISEWFKTFFFKNILYPFFYKRRDDPWGRIWAGFIALKDDENRVFRTNTLHAMVPYRVLYNNNNNTVSDNEIIIPPGWLWTYTGADRYTVKPYTTDNKVETARTLSQITNKFVFSNPFGIRIQKDPFAIGYFNPWINTFTSVSKVERMNVNTDHQAGDASIIYHAVPTVVNLKRTYVNDYYNLMTYINPTITEWIDGSPLARYVRYNVAKPTFVNAMWNYFKEPLDYYSASMPILRLNAAEGYVPFDPEKTYLCVKTKNRIDQDKWSLNNLWIEDGTQDVLNPDIIPLPITGDITMVYGLDSIWGDTGIATGVAYTEDTTITITPDIDDSDPITFTRMSAMQYYEMRLKESLSAGTVSKIVVGSAYKTELTKYNETTLWRIGNRYSPATYINVYFMDGMTEKAKTYAIRNSADILMPFEPELSENGEYVFDMSNVGSDTVMLYADMKPAPASGAYDHYRVKFSDLQANYAMFYVSNRLLPMYNNNIRVVIHAFMNGSQTGWVEMQPVKLESDGSYRYEINMYPLDELVDIDGRILIASETNGGGSWHSTVEGAAVSVDSSEPEFMITILIRTNDETFDPGIDLDDSFIGFRVVDQYTIDDISLVQELKEMRSVVNWSDSTEPTPEQINAYDWLMFLAEYNPKGKVFYDLTQYSHDMMLEREPEMTFDEFRNTCGKMLVEMNSLTIPPYNIRYTGDLQFIWLFIGSIANKALSNDDVISLYNELKEVSDGNWTKVFQVFNGYRQAVDEQFAGTNVNGGLEVKLVPYVASDLMISDKFETFVSAFTSVHKAIEPVIFKRLEGNNYLDCKLIATYGLPHSYSSDIDKDIEGVFWPDLNVQIEFDVKLYNNALASNTLNELKLVIKSYFNRLTSIHTPVDVISMNNNIYISNLIQQMKENENVEYLKFKGWYTNEKNIGGGNYMNADYQAIVQKWDSIEKMPTDELTRYVPEMFVLDDDNIVLNVL